MEVLDVSEGDTVKLLKLGHRRVGFYRCAVRLRTVILPCFKCLGYGHRKRRAHWVDQSTNAERQPQTQCLHGFHCDLCSELQPVENANQIAGSGKFCVFNPVTLEQDKTERRRLTKITRSNSESSSFLPARWISCTGLPTRINVKNNCGGRKV